MEVKPLAARSEPIYFWTNQNYAAFSNFYESPIFLRDRWWATNEHFFQAMKTLDFQGQEQIRHAPSPKIAKQLGKQVVLRSDWAEVRYDFMMEGLRAKFAVDPFRSLLLSTGQAMIYEDSPHDRIWGTGRLGGPGDGQNLLGKALVEVRAELVRAE